MSIVRTTIRWLLASVARSSPEASEEPLPSLSDSAAPPALVEGAAAADAGVGAIITAVGAAGAARAAMAAVG